MRVYDFTKMTPAQILEARRELAGQQKRNSDLVKPDLDEDAMRRLRRPKLIDVLNQKQR